MFNLLKMDFHRLTRTVSTWIFLVLAVCLAVFCVAMTDTDISALAAEGAGAAQTQTEITRNEDRSIGFSVEANPEWVAGDMDISEVAVMEMQSGLPLLICILFTAVFVNAEQKNGYIKNIAGQFPNRGLLVLSKWLTVAFWVLVLLLAFVATTVLAGFLLWGDRFNMGSVSELLRVLGVQYLLHLGFASLILFLCILTKSTAGGMVPGILVSFGLCVPLYSAVNKAVAVLFESADFDCSRYMLDGNISMVGFGAPSEVLLRAGLVGCAFAVVCTALSALVMQKRDIR